ncbi:MAG: hypothetical protein DMG70_07370 [Acidobacteria bacterium]|nr:MAG: hypothetical protein DMG70_07370 [Acidobacteriota bacterium]PYY08736.1 MAG: hypothetical protein DMG69_13500 [Acidobacteriota bacterium]
MDWIGWVATVVFAISYLFREPAKLRWIQAVAALLWLGYGLAIHALPVVVANAIVASAAVYSSFQLLREKRKQPLVPQRSGHEE